MNPVRHVAVSRPSATERVAGRPAQHRSVLGVHPPSGGVFLPPGVCCWVFLAVFALVFPSLAWAQADLAQKTGSQAESKKGPREFAPGVRIDWNKQRVELDARVVLREGPLELLACSPRTREHESIVSVTARPFDILRALGLIGLELGSPARYDEESESWNPPSGNALKISVRYQKDGKTIVEPVERWLQEVKSKKSPQSIDWVFSGSRRTQSGRFAADIDGTVICVVDFESALISVGTLHSADNELLWLSANTQAIPPIGTICTLLIQGVGVDAEEDATIYIDMVSVGMLRRNGNPIAPVSVRGWIDAGKKVVVRLPTSLPTSSVDNGLKTLDRIGIARSSYKIIHVDDSAKSGKPSSASGGG